MKRKTKTKSEKKGRPYSVRLTAAQEKKLIVRASRRDIGPSTYLRMLVVEDIEREG